MYKPKIYTEKDIKKIEKFIERYPFAQITGINSSGKPVATQVPLIFNENKQKLQGHVMKNTRHYKAFLQNPEVLVVFTGPDAYISGSWYKKPHVASTWNYMSVQIQGTLDFMPDDELVKLMKKFTLKFEDDDRTSPTFYDNIPDDYLKQHMQAIAGFEIKVGSMEAIFKLSQDKKEEDRNNVISQLKQKSLMAQQLAEEMEKKLKE
jgi:transcriptional regulator